MAPAREEAPVRRPEVLEDDGFDHDLVPPSAARQHVPPSDDELPAGDPPPWWNDGEEDVHVDGPDTAELTIAGAEAPPVDEPVPGAGVEGEGDA